MAYLATKPFSSLKTQDLPIPSLFAEPEHPDPVPFPGLFFSRGKKSKIFFDFIPTGVRLSPTAHEGQLLVPPVAGQWLHKIAAVRSFDQVLDSFFRGSQPTPGSRL